MASAYGSVLSLGLAVALGSPAAAQGEHCSHATLGVDGIAVDARFCISAGSTGAALSVAETFSALGKRIVKLTTLPVVAGANESRTIDDVDLRPIGPKRTLHMTLAYRAGAVYVEHALALPGAIPVK